MLVDVWGVMVRPCARIRRSQGRAQRVITPTIRRTLMETICVIPSTAPTALRTAGPAAVSTLTK